MKKLIALREWLSVAEAGSYLSTALEDEITEAAVLRLALDGSLKLSVYFVNHAEARRGCVVGYDDVQWYELNAPTLLCREDVKDGHANMRSMDLGGGKYLNLDDDIITVSGVWDLPMLGAERLDVEHAYQNLTDGPPVSLICLDGAFVESHDGRIICQIQERLYKESFERTNYYPAGKLPDDGILVVRTASLQEFERTAAISADTRTKFMLKQFSTNIQAEDSASDEKFIAGLFNPVSKEQLEAMFPDAGRWKGYAERQARNGLKQAAWVESGKFNPYLAAKWWIDTQGPAGWDWSKCVRKLASNLPSRSLGSKHLLTGDLG